MSKLKVLITGSGGFLMCNLVRRAIFSKKNWKISSLDKIRKSYVKHNIYINKDHSFYPSDILSEHFLNIIFDIETPDVVIHGAFDKENSLHNNILGTQNVINACKKWNVKKLILISTNNVINPSDKPQVESNIFQTTNEYIISRATAEMLVSASDIPNVILRLGEVFGPWQNAKNFIPKAIKNILLDNRTLHNGSSLDSRQWCHVHDICDAIMTFVDSNHLGTYNASSSYELTYVEVYNKIANLLNKGHTLLDVSEKSSESYLSDNSKISELWKPSMPFKDGISQTVQWYLDNKYFLSFEE
jgi:dTDP-glucose 4,6-dehydratase